MEIRGTFLHTHFFTNIFKIFFLLFFRDHNSSLRSHCSTYKSATLQRAWMNAIREMGIFIRANNISKPCLQFLTNILEILGVINFHRFKTKRRDLLQEVYCYFVTLVTLFHVVTHFINTTTRAVNYLPELFQRILEDFVIITVQFQFYLVRRKHAQLQELESFMENTFSRRIPAIVRRCNQTLRIFFCIFIIISALAFIGSFLEAFSALSEQIYTSENRFTRQNIQRGSSRLKLEFHT